jgi:hypothetical protein
MLKNITFSADDGLIQKARSLALEQNTTLNAVFREWLKQFTHQRDAGTHYMELMQKLDYANPGRKFTREEMNER